MADLLANPKYEVLSAAITLLSCVAYAIATLQDLPTELNLTLRTLEQATSVCAAARTSRRGLGGRREAPLELLGAGSPP